MDKTILYINIVFFFGPQHHMVFSEDVEKQLGHIYSGSQAVEDPVMIGT